MESPSSEGPSAQPSKRFVHRETRFVIFLQEGEPVPEGYEEQVASQSISNIQKRVLGHPSVGPFVRRDGDFVTFHPATETSSNDTPKRHFQYLDIPEGFYPNRDD